MSQIIYGFAGRGGRMPVIIDLVDVIEFKKESVTDQRGNYVYTKFRVIVGGIMTRVMNAYTGQAGGNPQRAGIVASGALSDVAVRHILAQPGAPFRFTVGGSQPGGFGTPVMGGFNLINTGVFGDAGSGPVPLDVLSVTQVIGSPFLQIRCGWDITVNESQSTDRTNLTPALANTNVTALASLTYKQEETINQDGCSQILTLGKAVFRGDVLRAMRPPATVDNFRDWLIMPPRGFTKRERVHVTAEEDGLTLSFAVLDRETYTRIIDRRISRIEGTHAVTAVSPSSEQISLSGFRAAADLWAAILGGGGSGINVGFRAVSTGLSWLNGAMPQLEHQIRVKVWGYSHIQHPTIAFIANSVLGSRLQFVQRNGSNAVHNAVITQQCDLTNPYVEVSATYTSGLLAAIGTNLFLQVPNLSAYFPPGTVDQSISPLPERRDPLNDIFPNPLLGGPPIFPPLPATQGIMTVQNRNAPFPQTGETGPVTVNVLDTGRRGNVIAGVVAQALATQDQLQPPTQYLNTRPLPLTP